MTPPLQKEPVLHGVGDVERAGQKLPAGHATWVAGVSQKKLAAQSVLLVEEP